MTDEIAFVPATRLISLYRDKKLSPVEVLAETRSRLELHKGALNAFVLYDPRRRRLRRVGKRASRRVYSTACR